jgi:hypothetical protein
MERGRLTARSRKSIDHRGEGWRFITQVKIVFYGLSVESSDQSGDLWDHYFITSVNVEIKRMTGKKFITNCKKGRVEVY